MSGAFFDNKVAVKEVARRTTTVLGCALKRVLGVIEV
jgi:hypothetical protein